MEIDRRQFGLMSFGLGLFPAVALPEVKHQALGTCYGTKDQNYGYVVFDEGFRNAFTWQLPERGHGSAYNASTNEVVVFARRPGTFLTIIDLNSPAKAPEHLQSASNRHFFGHGVFSHDFRYLYATENDFENECGRIGVYDGLSGYRKIHEFDAHGIGSHEIALLPDGRTLAVANGGIITHPAMPRRKLNLNAMEPSLCFIDRLSGDLIKKLEFDDPDLKQLSIRHITVDKTGLLVAGLQWEGDPYTVHPVLATATLDSELRLLDLGQTTNQKFKNYIGSVSHSPLSNEFIATSPRGGSYLTWKSGKPSKGIRVLTDVCGAASIPGEPGFIVTSGLGEIRLTDNQTFLYSSSNGDAILFDNHLISFKKPSIL